MSDETTARLALPLLQTGQAQKELTHNEALTLIDVAVQPIVQAIGLTVPPTAPLPGQCWIVGSAPTGAWTGQSGALAGWTAGGWRFVAPKEGMSAWSSADQCLARYRTGHWEIGIARANRLIIAGAQSVGPPQPAIAVPSGGSVVDVIARQTISEIITVLQQHGLIFGVA